MDQPTQDNRVIRLDTALPKDKLLLQGFSGQEGISIPFHYDLLLLSTDREIKFEDIVGTAATITLFLPDEPGATRSSDGSARQRLINGIIGSFTAADITNQYASYQATLVPQLWKLTRNADCRIFQDQSAADIIQTILKENNVNFTGERLTRGRYQKREYCVQYSETDFHFISRLMEEEGIFYFFEHSATSNGGGQHLMVLADEPSKFQKLPFLQNPAEIRAGGTADSAAQGITSWNVAQELRPDIYSLKDYNFKQPALQLTPVANTGKDATLEIYDFPGNFGDFDRGKQLTDVRIEEIETAKEVISGAGTYQPFTAGFRFNIKGHLRSEFNAREYVLTSIFHCFRPADDFFASADKQRANSRYTNSFQCIPYPTRYRPPRTTKVPLITGTQTAFVVGKNTVPKDGPAPAAPPPHTKKDEIYTDQYGRVRVKFHWDRAKENGDTTCWVRVAQAWAGKGWGNQWIPRIGQEVVVTFLEGDPDHPLITGAVYNGVNTMPFSHPDYVAQSGIRTRSNPGDPDGPNDKFNMLRFDDRAGCEQVFIRSQQRMDIRALGSYFETNGGDRNARIGWKDDKSQGGDFNIWVGRDQQIHVWGGLYERIEKKLNMTVMEDVVFDYESNVATMVKTKYELNAQQIILEAKDKISLKCGSSVVLIEPGGVTIYGSQVKINSGGYGVETGNPTIEDPLDAGGADTGKPGFLKCPPPAGSGGGGRHSRTLNSQHAPSLPRPGEDPRMTALRNTLETTAAGRHALDVYDRYGVNSTFVPGMGRSFSPSTNTVNLDPTAGPASGGSFVHEMNHAQSEHEGTSDPSSDPDRANYVDQNLQEEARGDAAAEQYRREQAAQGNPQPARANSAAYDSGYDQGVADYQNANPNATPEQLDQAGQAGGQQAVLDRYRAGQVQTSTTGQDYRQFYGNQWDNHHPGSPDSSGDGGGE